MFVREITKCGFLPLCLLFSCTTTIPFAAAQEPRVIRVHKAISKLETCLDNYQIPLGQLCDNAKFRSEEMILRNLHHGHKLGDLLHSREIALEEHIRLSKLKCIRFANCFNGRCKCLFPKCDHSQIRNSELTCQSEYNDLQQQIGGANLKASEHDRREKAQKQDSSRFYNDVKIIPDKGSDLHYNKFSDDTRPESKTPIRNADQLNRPSIDNKDFLEIDEEKNKISARIKLERETSIYFYEARLKLDKCLENLHIPINEGCNLELSLQENQKLYLKLLSNNGDFRKVSLLERQNLERLNCLHPSTCNGTHCICSLPEMNKCESRVQNKNISCTAEYSAYLSVATQGGRDLSPESRNPYLDFLLNTVNNGTKISYSLLKMFIVSIILQILGN